MKGVQINYMNKHKTNINLSDNIESIKKIQKKTLFVNLI